MKPGSPSFSFAKTFLEWNALRHSHATLVHSVQILCTQSELALPFCKGFPGMVSLNSSEVTSWMFTIDCFGILFKIEHFQDFLALVHKCPFAKGVCIQIQLPQRLPPDEIELLQDILTCTILAAPHGCPHALAQPWKSKFLEKVSWASTIGTRSRWHRSIGTLI